MVSSLRSMSVGPTSITGRPVSSTAARRTARSARSPLESTKLTRDTSSRNGLDSGRRVDT